MFSFLVLYCFNLRVGGLIGNLFPGPWRICRICVKLKGFSLIEVWRIFCIIFIITLTKHKTRHFKTGCYFDNFWKLALFLQICTGKTSKSPLEMKLYGSYVIEVRVFAGRKKSNKHYDTWLLYSRIFSTMGFKETRRPLNTLRQPKWM